MRIYLAQDIANPEIVRGVKGVHKRDALDILAGHFKRQGRGTAISYGDSTVKVTAVSGGEVTTLKVFELMFLE